MDVLVNIYERLNLLRSKGMKMKDIANRTPFSPSILSALYATVLPTYIQSVKESNKPEEALDYALSKVNNISRKRLVNSAADMNEKLTDIENELKKIEESSFLTQIDSFALETFPNSVGYLGLYLSYSMSSSIDALKIEPYLLFKSANDHGIKIYRKNAYNSINKGMALLNLDQSLYISLNESTNNQLALVTIYLQLPFFENPRLLRGIYLSLDYNRNPIARRIIFTKVKDSGTIQDLEDIPSKIVLKQEFSEIEQAYYDYTCQKTDYIRMCSIPSPKVNEQDLIVEKQILFS